MAFIFRQHLISLNKRMDAGEYVDFGQGPAIIGGGNGKKDDGDAEKGKGRALAAETEDAIRKAAELEGIDEEEALRRRNAFRYLV